MSFSIALGGKLQSRGWGLEQGWALNVLAS
jgi:hypothetical protein